MTEENPLVERKYSKRHKKMVPVLSNPMETVNNDDAEYKNVMNFLYAAGTNQQKITAPEVQAAKVWLQAKGRLEDKLEVKIGLSADEIARRNFEAERQLNDSGY